MVHLLGISGSLRAGSYNTALLRAASALSGDDVTLDVATLHGIPLYDADLEAREGLPPAVADLKARVVASDGVLLVTPEYNNGIPGVFKNALDWMSRGPGLAMFVGKPAAVLGASPGGFGTVLAQAHWLPVLRTLKTSLWTGGRMQVARAGTLFDDQGNLTDAATRDQLAAFVKGFAASL